MRKEVDNPYRTLMYTKEMYEYYAMEILKRWDSERYAELSHIGGNKFPDLQTPTCSIGVEVTCAFKPQLLKLNAYCAEYVGARTEDIPPKVTAELNAAGWIFGRNHGRTDVCYKLFDFDITEEEQVKLAIKAIQTKVRKLNTSKSCCECEQYELFILPNIPLRWFHIETIYKSIPSLYHDCDKIFTRIYIVSRSLLHVCEEKSLVSYNVDEIMNSAWRSAYTNSGMEAKSLALLKQQGHT